jgi:pimeloyl-ACP methyl ester carboxylesterase
MDKATITYPVKQWGKGQTVILLHGLSASQHDWESLGPVLAEAGYHACAPDLPGHGHCSKPADRNWYLADNYCTSLESWIESLQLDQPLTLVGHSFGGYLSLCFALRHPEKTRQLVLIDPLFRPEQLSTALRLILSLPGLTGRLMKRTPHELIDRVLGWDPTARNNFSPVARQQIAMDYKRASPYILYVPQTVQDLTTRLAELSCPCLVIWGEKDMTLRPSAFPELVERLPQAVAQPIPGSGHQPHIGKPDRINELILQFLSQPWQSAPEISSADSILTMTVTNK